VQWGANIIQGLIDGIRNMAGNLGGALRNVVNNAVDGVKSFLGLSSPSKLFEGFGVNVGEGFERGIDSMGRGVSASMAGMVTPPVSVAGAGVGPLDSGSQTINIDATYNVTDQATAEYANNDLVRKLKRVGLGGANR